MPSDIFKGSDEYSHFSQDYIFVHNSGPKKCFFFPLCSVETSSQQPWHVKVYTIRGAELTGQRCHCTHYLFKENITEFYFI